MLTKLRADILVFVGRNTLMMVANPRNCVEADIILIGVSRTGKTVTCICLVMRYGIAVTNYLLAQKNMSLMRLPKILELDQSKFVSLNSQCDPASFDQTRAMLE